jgi:hypothetical protein
MVLQQRQINIHDSQSVNHPSGLTLSALYFSALCSLSAINYVSDLLPQPYRTRCASSHGAGRILEEYSDRLEKRKMGRRDVQSDLLSTR